MNSPPNPDKELYKAIQEILALADMDARNDEFGDGFDFLQPTEALLALIHQREREAMFCWLTEFQRLNWQAMTMDGLKKNIDIAIAKLKSEGEK